MNNDVLFKKILQSDFYEINCNICFSFKILTNVTVDHMDVSTIVLIRMALTTARVDQALLLARTSRLVKV